MTSGLENVSRETLDKLSAYESLVRKWNPKINLVSKSSIDAIRERHIVDSVQLYKLADVSGHWVDLGSGGGFPGLVIAILNDDLRRCRITLVESDQRKCAFLRTALRELGIEAEVLNERIESLDSLGADILSARALADLPTLLEYAEMHLQLEGQAIFPKGATWRDEITRASESWAFTCNAVPSHTNESAAVLLIRDIARV